MENIKHELINTSSCDVDEIKMNQYLDYKDIVIEIDHRVLKFISSFTLGSFLSLEVLVDIADRFECDKCCVVFYSKSLFSEHMEANHSGLVDNGNISRTSF